MDFQQDYSLAKKLSHPLFEGMSIGLMSLAWFIFTYSAKNYADVNWYYWLISSRILSCSLGIGLLLYIGIKDKYYKNYSVIYLTYSLLIQATHGYFEGAYSTEFFNFTGLIFILASISYNGAFKTWLQKYFTTQLLIISLVLFTKSDKYFVSFATFVDGFSLIVAGVIIGTSVAYLTSSRFVLMKNYLLEKEEKYNMAHQIAHDIRSPLDMLNSLKGDLENLPKESKLRIEMSIKRIEDIAQGLLKHNKENANTSRFETDSLELVSLIEEVLFEKRIEFTKHPNLKIDFNSSINTAYSHIRQANFRRIISNLINNSVDSIENGNGHVVVKLFEAIDWNIIEISDTGKGIPESIKFNLFKKGMTSKSNGNGLGLYSAMEEVNFLAGKLSLVDSSSNGTTFRIQLPKSFSYNNDTPTNIILIDDDKLIRTNWKFHFEKMNIPFQSFESIDDFIKNSSLINKESNIYIDVNLKNGTKGNIDSKELYDLGFKNLFLSTGYQEEDINVPKWIKGVNTKDPRNIGSK